MKTRAPRSVLVTGIALFAGAVAASPAVADTTPPTTESIHAYGVNKGDEGYIRQNGTLYAYARNVQDAESGVQSVTLDASAVGIVYYSQDLTKIPMWQIPHTNDWYRDWRVKYPLPAGTYPWSVTVTDWAGNSTTTSSTVVVDNTKPTGTDVQTANTSGGVAGRAEQGDTLTVTFSEVMNKFMADETGRDVVVRIDNTSSNDTLKVYIETNGYEDAYVGQVKLGGNYVSSNRSFGAIGTKSRIVRSGASAIITLGTPSGSVNTVSSSGKMSWTPAYPTDRAGNQVVRTAVSETGTADREF